MKVVAQLGAVRAIEQLGLGYSQLGGTSGGAIIASTLAASELWRGQTPVKVASEEVWEFLTDFGLHRLVDVWYLPPVAFLQKRLYLWGLPLLAHLICTKGLVAGNVFLEEMRRILEKPDGSELRFKDLVNPGTEKDEHPARRSSLRMVATDISRGRPIVLPDDIAAYYEAWDNAEQLSHGRTAPLTANDVRDLWPVAEAVRMSMSIPFFFKPFQLHLNVRTDDRETVETSCKGRKGKKVLIVDGAVSSNFPIWLFDRPGKKPRWPTLGFLLDEHKNSDKTRTRTIRFLMDLAVSVVFTGMGAMDKRLSRHDEYRTARLDTLQVSTANFGLDLDTQTDLLRTGFENAVSFLSGFDWEYYLNEFRRKS